jgi:hypothetical protein
MRINYLLFFFSFLFISHSFSQVKEFDKLEMMFDQGHYKVVYRKSKLLLDKPEFDYSILPNYYKGISTLMLVNNRGWLRRHSKDMINDIQSLQNVMLSSEWSKYQSAKQIELSRLKDSLEIWEKSLIDIELKQTINLYLKTCLKDLKVNQKPVIQNSNPLNRSREELLVFAKGLIGTPYVYGGDSPYGFDCSGFVHYVFKERYELDLPRKASDQQLKSESIKEKQLLPGDLIFFDSGKGVSHVGIVVSSDDIGVKMIHASSSKGIIITNVTQSSYWKSKFHSYGRVVE